MADEKLVLVERFEELRTGIRVVVHCGWNCRHDHRGLLGPLEMRNLRNPAGERHHRVPAYRVLGSACDRGQVYCVTASGVDDRRVRRYAADLDMERELAAETARDKPYVGPVVAAAMRMGLLPQ